MNIGLIGCGNTSFRAIVFPAKFLDDVVVYGVSSRSYANACEFAQKHDIKKAFQTHEKLLNCSEIDTVYISLPNTLHAVYAEKALNAHKNVLLEKPLCLTAHDADIIRQSFNGSRGLLLEAVMVQHHPWQDALLDIIQREQYGKLKSVSTTINYPIKPDRTLNYRYDKKMGGGVLWDTSSYWLQFLQKMTDISSYSGLDIKANINTFGVDDDLELEMMSNDHIYIRFNASFLRPYTASHILIFENASISVRNYDRAALGFSKITLCVQRGENKSNIVFPPQNYYLNQLQFFKNDLTRQLSEKYLNESFARISLINEFSAKIGKDGNVSSAI